jgi:carbonic anhydrase/acetyltransferase-like protein (isoleucine patch superfamily)
MTTQRSLDARLETALAAPPVPAGLYRLPYLGVGPQFAGSPVHCGVRSAVLGRVTVGRGLWIGPRAVARADGHFVRLGDDVHLGGRATVHIAHEQYPAVVGDRVSVGENACVHACTVGSNCVVGDGAVVLDGSTVDDDVVIEPGSIVFMRSRLPKGHLCSGSPAKPVRPLAAGELEQWHARVRGGRASGAADGGSRAAPGPGAGQGLHPTVFVAATAETSGALRAEAGSSVWYGCVLDAGAAEIAVGANTNIQDNTIVRCQGGRPLVIGRDTTIGHNVALSGCTIGSGSLVGIGSVVAPGTVIEDRVLLAAGARTAPGQVLESGWMWGGDPARRISRLDDAKVEMIAWLVATYCQYAEHFKAAQEAAAGARGSGSHGSSVRSDTPLPDPPPQGGREKEAKEKRRQ